MLPLLAAVLAGCGGQVAATSSPPPPPPPEVATVYIASYDEREIPCVYHSSYGIGSSFSCDFTGRGRIPEGAEPIELIDEVRILDGKPLHCLVHHGYDGTTQSCDFERYHDENPR